MLAFGAPVFRPGRAFHETGEGQLGHRHHDVRVGGCRGGVVGSPTVGHRAEAAEVGLHDLVGGLAVLDRIFGLGELRRCRQGHAEAGKRREDGDGTIQLHGQGSWGCCGRGREARVGVNTAPGRTIP